MKNCKTNKITMRKIKFRAKRSDDGKWVFGDLTHEYRITRDKDIPCIRVARYNIDESSIGQFTGITDKNGKDIYEGDVIGCHNPNIKHLIFYNEKQGRFMAALDGDIENDFVGVCGLDDSRWIGSKKVIGNVYDNPELLKGGSEL